MALGINSLTRKFGVNLVHYKPNFHYVPDVYGRSSHKMLDIREAPLFAELAKNILNEGRSKLYYDRLFTIFQALQNLKSRFGSEKALQVCEFGVLRGGTTKFIATTAQAIRLKTTLHCFDTFEGHIEDDVNSAFDGQQQVGGFKKTSFEEVKTYLSDFQNIQFYVGRLQNHIHNLKSVPIHFIHLDVDLHLPTLNALEEIHRSVVSGGIIIVDDSLSLSCPGVKTAIDEFISNRTEFIRFDLLTSQTLLVKI